MKTPIPDLHLLPHRRERGRSAMRKGGRQSSRKNDGLPTTFDNDSDQGHAQEPHFRRIRVQTGTKETQERYNVRKTDVILDLIKLMRDINI